MFTVLPSLLPFRQGRSYQLVRNPNCGLFVFLRERQIGHSLEKNTALNQPEPFIDDPRCQRISSRECTITARLMNSSSPSVAGCSGNPDAKRLYDDLLSNYNKLVRPVVNVTDALTVKIKLKLSQLIDVVSFVRISSSLTMIRVARGNEFGASAFGFLRKDFSSLTAKRKSTDLWTLWRPTFERNNFWNIMGKIVFELEFNLKLVNFDVFIRKRKKKIDEMKLLEETLCKSSHLQNTIFWKVLWFFNWRLLDVSYQPETSWWKFENWNVEDYIEQNSKKIRLLYSRAFK